MRDQGLLSTASRAAAAAASTSSLSLSGTLFDGLPGRWTDAVETLAGTAFYRITTDLHLMLARQEACSGSA
ncbi:hypothetical protein [Mesorhizobium carmichaelinearum]|uniref:hypothetical protein n=1 Tax=Mesorhizobium carmichaelinearum TaxID=1208188 RepID=UPI000BA43075|nr:hypothetical protein [Mesorhizobium carmichaelinearum]